MTPRRKGITGSAFLIGSGLGFAGVAWALGDPRLYWVGFGELLVGLLALFVIRGRGK